VFYVIKFIEKTILFFLDLGGVKRNKFEKWRFSCEIKCIVAGRKCIVAGRKCIVAGRQNQNNSTV